MFSDKIKPEFRSRFWGLMQTGVVFLHDSFHPHTAANTTRTFQKFKKIHNVFLIFMIQSLCPWRRNSWYPLNTRLGRTQTHCGCCLVEKGFSSSMILVPIFLHSSAGYFVWTIFYRISRVLDWHIKSVGLHHINTSSLLHLVSDNLALKTPGVYRIPSECSKVNIRQMGHSVGTKIKEHQQHSWLEHLDKLAIAEQSTD